MKSLPIRHIVWLTVVPHELATALERAVLYGDIAGIGVDLAITARLRSAQNRDDRPGHAIRTDIAKGQVGGFAAGSGGDQDAASIRVRFPGIVCPVWVEHTSDKVTTEPAKVAHVLTSEDNRPSLIAKLLRKVKPHGIGSASSR